MSIASRPREVLEPLLELRRARRVRAPPVHLALGLHRRRAADRTALGRRPGASPLRPLLLHHAHDLGDHLPAALDEDGVAHPHVLAGDLLLVVEGRPAHGGPGQRHRREVGDRSQLAGAAHLHLDRLHGRRRLHRRVLVGDRPAGELRREAQLLLEGEVVDLDDDTVDLVLEARTLLAPLLDEREHLVEALAPPRGRVGAQPPGAERLERLPLAPRDSAPDVRDGIEEDVEAALRDDARVEALHRAGRRVPRVGERLLLRLLPLAVDGLEAGPRQVDLAARLELRRHVRALQHERYRADRPRVGRHVVAPDAVSARHRPGEAAAFVVQRHRQPVDLQLRGVGDLPLPHHPEDALLELPQLLRGVGVVEAPHRHPVHEARELLGRLLPTRWVGLSGVTRSGNCASRSRSSRSRASYSWSEISGRSRT